MNKNLIFQIQTDKQNTHAVKVDIAKRRGVVQDIEIQNESNIVRTLTPLAELVGYSTALRSMTSGTATFTMELDHYKQLSSMEQNKVVNSFLY